MRIDARRFEQRAREVFAPVYPVIAAQIRERTGITRGCCLDVGCGGGHLGIALAGISDLSVHLLDTSPEMLAIARGNVLAAGLAGRVDTILGDVADLPLADESVDLVVSRGSVFFWEDQQKAFEEICRALAPGGAAYVGGGFGTAVLRDEIAAVMEKREKNWRDDIRERIGPGAPEHFVRVLHAARVPIFSIRNDESGLWILMRKQAAKIRKG